jgi:5-formyltetrahydrofolate cyclo-ligase
MRFHQWRDPFEDSDLEQGPYGHLQPAVDGASAEQAVTPSLVFVPLLAFTAAGARLGQGGGHYDRWLAGNPEVTAVGMAWDSQLVDSLPLEPHDRALRAVVTPTRLYEGEA